MSNILKFAPSEPQNIIEDQPSSPTENDIDDLLDKATEFYCEYYSGIATNEYGLDQLHDELKKYIAARILGTQLNSSPEDTSVINLMTTSSNLNDRYLETVKDTVTKTKLQELHKILDIANNKDVKFNQILDIINDLGLDPDIPDDFPLNFSICNSNDNQNPTNTTPRARGRPKKVNQSGVIFSPNQVRRNFQAKAREVRFVFIRLLHHLFQRCAIYLKQTQTRILVNICNPILVQVEADLSKGSVSRSSRSKTSSQQPNSENPSSKRIKIETPTLERMKIFDQSPLNSEEGQRIDSETIANLIEAYTCLTYLESESNLFSKLWDRFISTNNTLKSNWFSRIRVDYMMVTKRHEDAIGIITNELNLDTSDDLSKSSDVNKMATDCVTPCQLRQHIQLISCYIQLSDRTKAYEGMNQLLNRMHKTDLINRDDGYSSGHVMEEYMVILKNFDNLAFLFFDSLSMIRYVVNVLLDILRKHVTSTNAVSDNSIGHAIVLSQFDWPKESLTYSYCVNWIRANKPKSTTPQSLSANTKFTYPEFFQFIYNPNIIEDFMFMLSHGFTLDIKSNDSTLANSSHGSTRSSNSQERTSGRSSNGTVNPRSGKAITTRGLNKTFKEDLKVSLIDQMRRSQIPIPLETISEFIQDTLLTFLQK